MVVNITDRYTQASCFGARNGYVDMGRHMLMCVVE
jgi:hypothetical protein